MALTRYRLGDLLEIITETNADLEYGAKDVMGMTITKELIPTKAKIGDNDLSKYIVVKSNEFVFNPRTHGKKIGFGYNDSDNTYLISWNNNAFRVTDAAKTIVLPKYLFLHFNRNEWDREACFRSWGSSTEVFSWSALCEMELDLPPIEVQRKYVAVYEAMCANQRCYEAGLEDLKLACDAEIEQLMGSIPLIPIVAFVDETDERNEGQYSLSNVRGISIEKKFIPTKAKMEGVSLSNYKVVRPREIAYVPVTSRNGEKITIAQNISDDTFLISAAYLTLKCDEARLLPEYLMLFFTRSEFDRYARFNSWGSARETFDWTEMENVKIPIPSLDVQRSIADLFKAYNERKEINEKLKQQIRDLCPILIKGSLEEASKA